MEFSGVDRLQNEINNPAYQDGRAGIQEHPLEPINARITLSKRF
jgi:hypothetical protein